MISLIGYMGSGKSTVAKAVSADIGIEFIDLDKEIEKSIDQSIQHIFRLYGDFYFRSLERKVLRKILISQKDGVLSLGGGTPCYYNNMSIINRYSTSIYLEVPSDLLHSRLSEEREQRPLLYKKSEDELRDFINQHIDIRREYYSQAKYTINNIDLAETKASIIEIYNENIHKNR